MLKSLKQMIETLLTLVRVSSFVSLKQVKKKHLLVGSIEADPRAKRKFRLNHPLDVLYSIKWKMMSSK